MANCYLIGLGTSHPNPHYYLSRAIACLSEIPGLALLSKSVVAFGGGVGTDDAWTFYNQVIFVSSPLSLTALWFEMAFVETRLGRIRTKVNGPRTIDLDLLFWSGMARSDSFITMPHPRFFERKFARDLAMNALKNAGEDTLLIAVRTK